jgi:hypothetical protein
MDTDACVLLLYSALLIKLIPQLCTPHPSRRGRILFKNFDIPPSKNKVTLLVLKNTYFVGVKYMSINVANCNRHFVRIILMSLNVILEADIMLSFYLMWLIFVCPSLFELLSWLIWRPTNWRKLLLNVKNEIAYLIVSYNLIWNLIV